MKAIDVLFDVAAAESRLMRYLSVEGITGEEAAIAAAITEDLEAIGVPKAAIRFDDANARIPLPTETGNLIVDLPGTKAGPRLLFSTHLDTVPLCAGAKPKREGDKIVSEATTALGGDNRTGCAVLVTLAETLLKRKLPHPPITLLFTVREESGLHGARELKPADLHGPVMGFNVDGDMPSKFLVGAVGQENWQVEIRGKAAHAGVAPEKGISATLVAAIAIADAHKNGWFGKVVKGDDVGTSNVGIFGGTPGHPAGDATNVVTDFVAIKGEARSPKAEFATKIASEYKAAFMRAEAAVTDVDGATSEVKFEHKPSYPPFKISQDSDVARRAGQAAKRLGLEPSYVFSNGGLDANWIDKHGIPTITFGAGQREIHTVKEYVELEDFRAGCKMAIVLATLDD
jgi:tripeptide aminopeptidase